jgi:hypothetical protein
MADGAGGAGGASFYEILGQMIHCSSEEASELVKGLNKNVGSNDFFIPYFNNLPEVKIINMENKLKYGNAHTEQVLQIDNQISSGHFSVVLSNAKKISKPFYPEEPAFSYKVISKEISSVSSSFLYLVFKEIIIQTFLQSDTTVNPYRRKAYGDSICKLFGVYRTKDEIILKLEYLRLSYKSYLLSNLVKTSIMEPATPAEMDKIIKSDILTFLTLLKYFRDKYNFHHQDLKIDNMMIGNTFEFKIIDFGFASYIEIDGVQIGNIEPARDDSYKFIKSLLVEIGRNITPGFNATLEALKSSCFKTIDEYIVELKRLTGGSRKKTKRLRKKKTRSL